MPVILFCLSSLILALEVLETKIFSYSLENSLIFLVVGVVLLGFGAGGSVLALKKKLGDVKPLVSRNLLIGSLLLLIGHAYFAQFSHRLEFQIDFFTISILLLLASPYFSLGMAISAILADEEGNIHVRYGINLIGSAVGCLLVFFILGPLTGAQCLVICAFAIAVLAFAVSDSKPRVGLGIVLVFVPSFLFAESLFPYQIQKAETAGQLALIEKNAALTLAANDQVQKADVVEFFDRWDPTSRVQVHGLEIETTDPNIAASLEKLDSRWFTQDSSYGSPLIGRGRNPEGTAAFYDHTCYGIGYFRQHKDPNVLIIGLGGSPDVQSAIHHEAAKITGVDINATTVAMVRGPMADYLGDPYGDPRVTIHLSDGRSYVRGTDEKFDLIQLSGVDTKSILSSGTLALNESYLYTQEGMDEYLSHLTDDGILCINYAGDHYRDRLLATAFKTLAKDGITEPWKHVCLAKQQAIFSLLIKRTPFTSEECEQFDTWIAAADIGDGSTGVVVWVYELLSPGLSLHGAPKRTYVPDSRGGDIPLITAAQAGELDSYLAELAIDIAPAPDKRPFFFNIDRNERIYTATRQWLTSGEWLSSKAPTPAERAAVKASGNGEVYQPLPAHFQKMFRLLILMAGMSVILILGPLVVQARNGLKVWSNLPFAFYFAALGAGFICAMSGLIQRYVLFLGHQAYAFAVVIGGLLVAAGIGSMLAGRMKAQPRKVMILGTVGICAMLTVLQFGLAPLFGVTAGLDLFARILVSLAALFPLGVCLGMMFPIGLGLVKESSPLFVPWAFGINGVFSVIGTTIVLPGSIMFGFPTMSVLAGGIYVFALLVGLPLARARSAG